ncbi:o-succinylbenzoate synthase [Psychromicrobium sp. YIM B11713]|uniref:o-succinylbenzoate synthase n=1 Tax=Psychromicrobium sp. YIM B11713 TaxID=3145233 RepID=UPI00374E6F1F
MPDIEELLDGARVVALPMRNRFRGITSRETLLLRGPAAWAEFGPFAEYDDVEAARWLRAALEAGWSGFPPALRSSIPVNATVPAVAAAQVGSVLEAFGEVSAVKIKVAEPGQQLEEDLNRVAEVRRLLPRAAVRIDANAGWSHSEALEALRRLVDFDLEYAEQPVAGIPGLARLREALSSARIELRIAADESVRKETDPLAVARQGAADLLVIKVAPLGGVKAALDIVSQAGLPVVVSSALDTSVGIRAGLALAAALPELPFACGLGTVALLAADVCDEPLTPRNGRIGLREAVPDPELLQRYRVAREREEWWLERLRRVHALLQAEAPRSGN